MSMKIPEPEHQLKVPVVRRKMYTLYLEQATPSHTFIHCDIHGRWAPWVKRALEADWNTLHGLHGGPLYALHNPNDIKHAKFITMFGFKKAASFKDSAGRSMEIYITH